MEKETVINSLNPAKDGFLEIPEKFSIDRINCGIVVNTDGEYRLIDESEVAKLWRELDGKKKSFPIGDYMGITNNEKILNCGNRGYVVGSILILNIDPSNGPKAFSPNDVTVVMGLLENNIVVLSTETKEHLAYEMFL